MKTDFTKTDLRKHHMAFDPNIGVRLCGKQRTQITALSPVQTQTVEPVSALVSSCVNRVGLWRGPCCLHWTHIEKSRRYLFAHNSQLVKSTVSSELFQEKQKETKLMKAHSVRARGAEIAGRVQRRFQQHSAEVKFAPNSL